ncbi:MAG: hypothetical protein ACI9BD_000857 [Candidatus Marinamargulisbacteria bacterium]|jgi:hypothetical protein
MKHRLALLALFLLVSSAIHAIPTIHGPTGLIAIPTAEALKYKEFNVGMDYMMGAQDEIQDWRYKLNLGTFQNWELGVVGGKTPTEGVFVNAKYYLMSDESRYPLAIAIGTENLSSNGNTSIYMVASKKFQESFDAHLGFRAIFGEKELDPTLMFGLEYFLNNKFSVIADIDGEGQNYTLNAGSLYYLSSHFVLRTAVIDLLNTKNEGTFYSFGLSFSKFL